MDHKMDNNKKQSIISQSIIIKLDNKHDNISDAVKNIYDTNICDLKTNFDELEYYSQIEITRLLVEMKIFNILILIMLLLSIVFHYKD